MIRGKCPVCKKESVEIVEGSHNFLDSDEIAAILKDHPSWDKEKDLCEACVDHYKMHH